MTFDSYMLKDDELKEGQPRLLSVDKEVVVPVGKTVHLLTTANDVIHSWAMPSFGVKIDSIPGRMNEDWFRVEREGVYYGQCSELCGKDHAFMRLRCVRFPRTPTSSGPIPPRPPAWTRRTRKLAEILAAKEKLAQDRMNPAVSPQPTDRDHLRVL